MSDTQSETESLLAIIRDIDKQSIMLPEFQRDFRWDIDQTFALFDSLIRDIFVGTIIYGKPSFGMTLREIDKRPRRGKGSRTKIQQESYSTESIKKLILTRRLRVVLDGQQRLTSLYRAMTGKGDDRVYLRLKKFPTFEAIRGLELEQMLHDIGGEPSAEYISVLVSDAYRAEVESLEDEDLNNLFDGMPYARRLSERTSQAYRDDQKIFRRAVSKLRDLFKQEKLIAYYMLDMGMEKFCLFFERSNSRGIQLNFTDILAAKLYTGFNLRGKMDEFQDRNKGVRLNREVIIRTVAYMRGRDSGGTISIDRTAILENLEADDFKRYWDDVCKFYEDSIAYLTKQRYVVSWSWLPLDNLLIPLMIFRWHLRGFDQMTEEKRRFLEFWFWSAIFSNRYSSASNEAIVHDSRLLEQVARGESVSDRTFFARLRPQIHEADDLLSYTRPTSGIYRGVLNLLGYAAHGLRDWQSNQLLQPEMNIEAHHIFPRAYLVREDIELDVGSDDVEELMNSVVNIALIPKLTNIKIGKKAPSQYLGELQRTNAALAGCLTTHAIPADLLDPDRDAFFKDFLIDRAKQMLALIQQYTTSPQEPASSK